MGERSFPIPERRNSSVTYVQRGLSLVPQPNSVEGGRVLLKVSSGLRKSP